MEGKSPIDPSEHTVDELAQRVENGEHSLEQLRALREAERDGPDRSTAIELLDEVLDDRTAEPSVGGSTDTAAGSMRHVDGGGATEIGVVGVDLPSPYSDGAPETLRIHLESAMGVGGVMFDEPGVHTIAYATPNGEGVAGMRVKRTLESPTNPARLAESDPLHPNHEE